MASFAEQYINGVIMYLERIRNEEGESLEGAREIAARELEFATAAEVREYLERYAREADGKPNLT